MQNRPHDPGAHALAEIYRRAERWESLLQASNHPIQNAASDACLLRAAQLDVRYPWLRTVTLTHDSVLWEVKSPEWAARRIRTVMEDPDFYWGTLDPALTMDFTVYEERWGSRPQELKL